MSFADTPLDQNPYWNGAYHLRFAYEYTHTAFVLDRARQPAEHYRSMAVQQLKDAAAALGYSVVEISGFNVTPKPLKPVADLVPASNIRPGDYVNGSFMVGDVGHGALDGQIKLRNPDDTATMLVMDTDLVLIEREVSA